MATDKTRAVGVDIGGTGIKAAIVDLEAGTLLPESEQLIAHFQSLVVEALAGQGSVPERD